MEAAKSLVPHNDDDGDKAIMVHSEEGQGGQTTKPHERTALVSAEAANDAQYEKRGKEMIVAGAKEGALVEYRRQPKEKIRIALVDATSYTTSLARDTAEENLTTAKGELKGISGFFKRVFKYNLFREYTRLTEIAKVKKQIQSDIDSGQGVEYAASQEAYGAIATRFVEDLTHDGEQRNILPDGDPLATELKNLVLRHAQKAPLDTAALNSERDALIQKHHGKDAHLKYATNLEDVVLCVQAAIQQGQAIEDLQKEFEVIVGTARAGVRTEAAYTAADKAMMWLQEKRFHVLANESTLAAALGIMSSVGTATVQRGLTGVANIVTFGGSAVVGGGIAALREGQIVKSEHAQHHREMAQSKTIDAANGARRQEMQTTVYEMKDATALIDAINCIYEANVATGKVELKSGVTAQEIDQSLTAIGEAKARIRLSDTQHIDLIRYSSARKVESERTALDVALARAQSDIKKWLRSNPGALAQQGSTVSLTPDQYVASCVQTSHDAVARTARADVQAKDKVFDKMRRKKMSRAAIMGLGAGLVVGFAAQEASAAINPHQQGFIEGAFGHRDAVPVSQTPLESLNHYLFGGAQNSAAAANTINAVPAAPNTHTVNMPVNTWAQQNGAVQIDRGTWLDQNTASPLFDKNELRLHWGGAQGTGVDTNGNYVFDVGKMTKGGSYHGALSPDAQQLARDGRLFMIITPERGGPSFKVPIAPNGQALIDPKSAVGSLFSTDAKGHAVFNGKWAEVAYTPDPQSPLSPTGGLKANILATHVGKGSIQDVPVTVTEPTPVPVDTPPPAEVPTTGDLPTVYPILPVAGPRAPLEKLVNPDANRQNKPQADKSLPPTRKSTGTAMVSVAEDVQRRGDGGDDQSAKRQEGTPIPADTTLSSDRQPFSWEKNEHLFFQPIRPDEKGKETVYTWKYTQFLTGAFGKKPGCTLGELRSARREWLRKHGHPDQIQDPVAKKEAEEKLARVNFAMRAVQLFQTTMNEKRLRELGKMNDQQRDERQRSVEALSDTEKENIEAHAIETVVAIGERVNREGLPQDRASASDALQRIVNAETLKTLDKHGIYGAGHIYFVECMRDRGVNPEVGLRAVQGENSQAQQMGQSQSQTQSASNDAAAPKAA